MPNSPLNAWKEAFPGSAQLPFPLELTGPGIDDGLYTIAALYDQLDPARPETWVRTYDHANYKWFLGPDDRPRPLSLEEAIAARIHDAGIAFATDRYLKRLDSKVVGFMGGHNTARRDPSFRQVAVMARAFRRKGLQVVTGGGPGLMEAANFGAFLAPFPDEELDRTLAILQESEFSDGNARWLGTACRARAGLLGGDWRAVPPAESRNLGIPTWHYGNEPPNVFATAIGKYFFNSVREDGLIGIASGGLVFGTGAAGTVQEIFQNATLNYYRLKGTRPTPMVFLGSAMWNAPPAPPGSPAPKWSGLPAYPLVTAMANDGDFAEAVQLSDDPEAVIRFIEEADTARPTVAERRLENR